jgi:transposase
MDLTDAQWQILEPIFRPRRRPDGRGRPWHDTRAVVNGVLWVLRTGAPGTTCLAGIRRTRRVIAAFSIGSGPGYSDGCCAGSPRICAIAANWI